MKYIPLLIALMTIATSAIAQAQRPLIIAHRGASAYAPENTTAAIELSWEMNADGAEFDIYTARDNTVVAIHDTDTSRVTDGKIVKTIAETDSADLCGIDVGTWKDKKFSGICIPTLDQVFENIPPGKLMVIEIKDKPETVAHTAAAIRRTGKSMDQFIIISFKMEVCDEARKLLPEIPVYWLDSPKKPKPGEKMKPFTNKVIEEGLAHNLPGINLNYKGVTEQLVKDAHAAGLKLLVWTVDEPDDIRRMAEWGVDAITTNKPDLALKIVTEMAETKSAGAQN